MDRDPSAERTLHPSGILEALIATAIGGGLLPAVDYAWKHGFHSAPPEWARGALPSLGAAAVLIPAVWLSTRFLRRVATRRQRKTARAKGDRLSIYVARLGEDETSETARASVMDSIRAELGPERVEVLPAGIQLSLTEGVSLDEAALDASRKARALLAKNHGDLLIWGRVHKLPEQKAVIDLRFVSAAQPGLEGQRFGFTDKLTLEAGFGPEMGAALAAVAAVLAAPAASDAGRYIAGTLKPVADRLAPLAHDPPPSMRPDDRGSLLASYGLAQYVTGEQSGDASRLEEAVVAYREALKEYTRERVPLDWAMTQNNLGNALGSLGERESGTERLEGAVAAYREALKEYTRERVPLKWAMTQNNLGTALSCLGERESGTERLDGAVTAYREALKEYTPGRVPLRWAGTQNNLGNALRSLGERESGTERLEEAVAAYRKALNEYTRERVPLAWAMTQDNLGTALWCLGERESGTGRLEEAVAAYREALKERTRERVPLDWAMTQNNLGNALWCLGEQESGTERLEEAVAAYREALKERTHERVPLDWAMTQNNLGNALGSLGERESGTERLEEAVVAYQQALEVFTSDTGPHYQSIAQSGLARATELLEARKPRGR